MAIRSLAAVAASTAELKNKIVGVAVSNQFDYVESDFGNITIRGILPKDLSLLLAKELSVTFTEVNPQALQANVGELKLTLAGQGESSLAMIKSY